MPLTVQIKTSTPTVLPSNMVMCVCVHYELCRLFFLLSHVCVVLCLLAAAAVEFFLFLHLCVVCLVAGGFISVP